MSRRHALVVALVLASPLACEDEASSPSLTYTPSSDAALLAGALGAWEHVDARGRTTRVVLCEDQGASYCNGRELCHDYRGEGRGVPETMPASAGGCDGPGASAGAVVVADVTGPAGALTLRGTFTRSWAVAHTAPVAKAPGDTTRGAYDGPFMVSLSSTQATPDRTAAPRVIASFVYDGALSGHVLPQGARVDDTPPPSPPATARPLDLDGGPDDAGATDAGATEAGPKARDAGAADPRYRKVQPFEIACATR
jgi:hypothetical protein